MTQNNRRTYVTEYAADRNYGRLPAIHRAAIEGGIAELATGEMRSKLIPVASEKPA